MKNILAVLMLFVTLQMNAQNGGKGNITLSGIIKNASSKQLVLTDNDNVQHAKISVGDNGEFCLKAKLPVQDYYLVDEKNNYTILYLEEGVELHVEYDESNYKESLKLTGKNIVKTKFKQDYLLKQGGIMNAVGNMYELNPKAYMDFVKNFEKSMLSLVNEYENKIAGDFLKYERGSVHYTCYALVMQYASGKKESELTDDYKKVLNDIDFNDEGLYKNSYRYRIFFYNTFAIYSNLLGKQNKKRDGQAILEYIESTIANDYIKNIVLQGWFEMGINNAKNKKALYDKFMSLSNDKAVQAEVTKKYKEVSKTDKGNPSPVFKDYIKYGGGKASLSDFKGKYVYIDFWATWCGACIQEFPHLKEIEKEYHGKNIVFVGISLDKSNIKAKWEKLIEKKGLEGIQLLADNALESKFATDYNIQTIPRFILIDPNGNIVDANAPRPSEPELKELLNSLPL